MKHFVFIKIIETNNWDNDNSTLLYALFFNYIKNYFY